MAKDVATASASPPGEPPKALDRDLSRELGILLNKLESPGRSGAIDPGVRKTATIAALEQHRTHLRLKERPIGLRDLMERLTTLFIGYPQMHAWARHDYETFLKRCVLALQEYPLWAIAAAFKPLSIAKDRNSDFPPSAETLAELAEAQMVPLRRLKAQLDLVLDAKEKGAMPEPELSLEERAAIVDRAKAQSPELFRSTKPRVPKGEPPDVVLARETGRPIEEIRAMLAAMPGDPIPEFAPPPKEESS